MSHELENSNDMIYVGETPWHDLGIKVDSIDELPDCINWGVETQPVFLSGQTEPIKGHVAIVRPKDNRVFGIATEDYVPHQNKQLWETFVSFCDEGNMKIETAGALKGGEIIWILAKIQADSIKVGSDYDKTDLYALMGSGHNNKLASFTKPTAIRVVCNNTFNIAVNDGKITDRQIHRSEFDVKRAKDFVSHAILGFNMYHELADKLVHKNLVIPSLSTAFAQEVLQPENLDKAIIAATQGNRDLDSLKKTWIDEIFSSDAKKSVFEELILTKSSRPVKQLIEAIKAEKGLDTGNWWHQFNGATRYVDHMRSRTTDTRLYNAWFGSGAQIKQSAFEKALEYAEAA